MACKDACLPSELNFHISMHMIHHACNPIDCAAQELQTAPRAGQISSRLSHLVLLLLSDGRAPGSPKLLQKQLLQMLDSLLLLQPEHLADDHKLSPMTESNSCGSVAYAHDSICQRVLDMPAVLDAVLPGIPHLLRSLSAGAPIQKAVLMPICYCREYVNGTIRLVAVGTVYHTSQWCSLNIMQYTIKSKVHRNSAALKQTISVSSNQQAAQASQHHPHMHRCPSQNRAWCSVCLV